MSERDVKSSRRPAPGDADRQPVAGWLDQLRRTPWARRAEYGLLGFLIWGLVFAINDADRTYSWGGSKSRIGKVMGKLVSPDDYYWVGLLTLALWTAAPLVMRPLTTSGATPQQRYAVSALTLGAGVVWAVWVRESLDDQSPSGLGIVLTIGLVAFAGFLRLGWGRGSETTKSPPRQNGADE